MMRKVSIGITFFVIATHTAVAATSAAVTDPVDQLIDGRTGSQAAPIWDQPASSGTVQTVTAPPAPAAPPERTLSANPLWAIPLAVLSGTRDRPIFSSSRRPPVPPPVAAAPKTISAPKPKEPERPQLSLVGTIAGDVERFGIFTDQSAQTSLRLKVGEDYQGWKLRSIEGRQAVLEKDQQAVTLELPQPGQGQATDDSRPIVNAGKSFAVAPQPPASPVLLNPAGNNR